MTKLDEGNYHSLSPEERVNLTIAALSRGDNEEVLRLRRTCARKQYLMLDHEYTCRLERLALIASNFESLHNTYYLNMILFSGYMATHEIDDTYIKYHTAYNDQAECIVSLYAAFDAFCLKAGLNKTNAAAWLKIDPKPIYDFIGKKALSTLQPDPVLTTHLKNRFLAIWNGDIN